MLLKHQWVNDKIKEEILTYLEVNDNENTIIKDQWDAAKTALRGKSIVIQSLLKKKKWKISNTQPNSPPKRIRKGRTKKILSHQKEGDNKDQRGN